MNEAIIAQCDAVDLRVRGKTVSGFSRYDFDGLMVLNFTDGSCLHIRGLIEECSADGETGEIIVSGWED